ncbi:MAG: hypothetical protein Q8R20_00745 [Nanoarchaeota archaeon]|nr:hypothetical protein [Nanoarchaeota archaeon]
MQNRSEISVLRELLDHDRIRNNPQPEAFLLVDGRLDAIGHELGCRDEEDKKNLLCEVEEVIQGFPDGHLKESMRRTLKRLKRV